MPMIRDGQPVVGRQARQECLDLCLAHLGRVPKPMEVDERATPLHA